MASDLGRCNGVRSKRVGAGLLGGRPGDNPLRDHDFAAVRRGGSTNVHAPSETAKLVYQRLTEICRWTDQEYHAWLATTLSSTLLDPG